MPTVPGFPLWLKSAERRQYNAVKFLPGLANPPPDVYNLWRGWGCASIEGDWSLLRCHIENVICNGNAEHFRWLMTWLAQTFQQPMKRPPTACLLTGAPGAGKSTLSEFLQRLVGKHQAWLVGSHHVTGHFNAHFQTAIFIFLEEAVWAGDRQDSAILKSLISSKTLHIEPKGKDGKNQPIFARLLATANEGWAANIERLDRRWFVLEVSDQYAGNTQYFDALRTQMENGGYEAFLFDLLHWDISQCDLNRAPRTEAREVQATHSMSASTSWGKEALEERIFDVSPDSRFFAMRARWPLDEEYVVPRRLVVDSYQHHVRQYDRNLVAPGKVAESLRLLFGKVGVRRPGTNPGGRERCFVLPPQRVARQHFEKTYGVTVSSDDEDAVSSGPDDGGTS